MTFREPASGGQHHCCIAAGMRLGWQASIPSHSSPSTCLLTHSLPLKGGPAVTVPPCRSQPAGPPVRGPPGRGLRALQLQPGPAGKRRAGPGSGGVASCLRAFCEHALQVPGSVLCRQAAVWCPVPIACPTTGHPAAVRPAGGWHPDGQVLQRRRAGGQRAARQGEQPARGAGAAAAW